MPERRPNDVSAGGVVIRRTDEGLAICLVRVRERWEIPKGHPDHGESAADAAVREISEETGLPQSDLHVRATLTPLNYVFRSDGRLIFKRVDTFLIECVGEPSLLPQADEVADAAWFPVADAIEAAAFPDTKKLLREAEAMVNRPSE